MAGTTTKEGRRVSARTKGRANREQEAVLDRLTGALPSMVRALSPSALDRALSASGAVSTIGVVVDELLKAHPDMAITDPMAMNEVRLAKARETLVKRAGGALTTEAAAELLGTTAEAVRQRIRRGKLLSFQTSSGEHRLPRVQFTAGGVIKGLDAVLSAIHVQDGWMRTQLFLDVDVLGALRDGRIDDAVRAVSSYLPRDEG